MGNWSTFTARLSLFIPPAAAVEKAVEIYQRLWETFPDGYQSDPNPLAPSIARAKRNNLSLACQSARSRIDISFSAVPREKGANLDLIQDSSELLAELRRVITGLNGRGPRSPVMRVALILQVVSPSSSVPEANRELAKIMPPDYRLKLTDETDFILQVNHPLESVGSSRRQINFIKKWSTERIQIQFFEVPGGAGAAPIHSAAINPMTEKEFTVSSVTLDINNSPTNESLPPPTQAEILGGAVSMASEFLRKSDLHITGF